MNSLSLFPRKPLARNPGRHTLALLLFICFMLLGAQIATLAHGADHPFHHHTELCDSLSAFQHSSALLAQIASLAVIIAVATLFPALHVQILSCIPSAQNSRAPPAFFTPR